MVGSHYLAKKGNGELKRNAFVICAKMSKYSTKVESRKREHVIFRFWLLNLLTFADIEWVAFYHTLQKTNFLKCMSSLILNPKIFQKIIFSSFLNIFLSISSSYLFIHSHYFLFLPFYILNISAVALTGLKKQANSLFIKKNMLHGARNYCMHSLSSHCHFEFFFYLVHSCNIERSDPLVFYIHVNFL